jgi:conjugative transfer pilus assembly protein TraH
LALGQAAHADLDQQLNSAFGVLVNTTPPTASLSDTRRGVISGGSLIVRNQISRPQLVSFIPPSHDGGCGGLSWFGGSFSFINAAQFQQLLRNIASSALSYAFELAISAMSENVLQAMRRFQRVISAMNRHMGNSCQLAQGIVNDALDAANLKDQTKGATNASFMGMFDDMFAAMEDKSDAHSQSVAAGEFATDCSIDANIVWCSLKQNNIATSFFAGGDDALLEAIQTITGTVVVGSPEAHPDGGNVAPPTFLPGLGEVVEAILTGGNTTIYACADGTDMKQCRQVAVQTRTIQDGFVQQMHDLLLDPVDGVVTKLRDPYGTPLTQQQLYFLTNAPGGIGPMLRNIAVKNPNMAVSFAERATPIVAIKLVEQILSQIDDTVNSTLSANDSGYRKELLDIVSESRRTRSQKLKLIQEHYGNLPDIYTHYLDVLAAAPRAPYGNQLAKTVYHAGPTGR